MHGAIILMTVLGLSPSAAGESRRYENLSPDELKAAIAKYPVAYFPAGIAEWHGEQSACGLDALKAETLCRMAAETLGGVCFQTLWTGPGSSTPFDPTRYPRGTLTIDSDRYLQAAEQLLSRIEKTGFRVAVYLSGHYPGVIPTVAEKFNQRDGMKVISVSENKVVKGMFAGDHAAAWETSLLMALRPGLVDLGRLPPLPAGFKHAGDVIPEPWPFHQHVEFYGVYGADPRIWASEFFGRKGTEAVIDGLAREVANALGDSSYGKDRGQIAWPKDERDQPEVRYDFQLPYQWIGRFEAAPIVYWPVVAGGESAEGATQRAVRCACQIGGMVFPPFPYAPHAEGGGLALAPELFASIARGVVETLADMGFRVVVVQPGAHVAKACRDQLAELKLPGDQARLIVVDPDESATVPAALADAKRKLIPDQGHALSLDGRWIINGERPATTLGQVIWGPPGDTRTYELAFKLTEDQAKQSAMLDLGTVVNHAEVKLNDSPPLADHWPPYRLIVTGRLKAGENQLLVTVRNQPQPTLDQYFFRPGPPELKGPVSLVLWQP